MGLLDLIWFFRLLLEIFCRFGSLVVWLMVSGDGEELLAVN